MFISSFTCRMIALLLIAVLPTAAVASETLSVERIATMGERALSEMGGVGLSIGMVDRDGRLVQVQLGVRDLSKPEPVGPHTLFPIASLSKAFTSAALAILAERGKLEFDAPVRRYMPDFDMGDTYVNAHFTVRDLLTHRSGLPLGAGDLLWGPDGDGGVEDVLKVLKAIKPVRSLREGYDYDNILYILGGELIRRVDGRSWETFIREEIFRPLGMKECRATPAEFDDAPDRIVEHAPYPGSKGQAPVNPLMRFREGSNGATGISCTVSDLARWATMWLNEGAIDGDLRLLKKESVADLWTIVTPMRTKVSFSDRQSTHITGYALGWQVADMDGRITVSHSGGSYGATAYLVLAPEEGLAAIALSNSYSSAAGTIANAMLSEVMSSGTPPPEDVMAQGVEKWTKLLAEIARGDADAKSAVDAKPPALPLDAYAGLYRDPWYGDITVSLADGKLAIDMSRSQLLDGPLTPFDGNRFVALWPERRLNADAYVDFIVEEGRVTGLTMTPVSDAVDFSYDYDDLKPVRVSASE